jgi:predicted secreted protein
MSGIMQTLLSAHDPSYNERRIAHYNEWVKENKGPYPGFPPELELQEGIELLKRDMQRKNKAKKTGSTGLKTAKAVEIYKKHNGNKALVIEEYQKTLGMTKAGATTYFYNAKKST